MTCHRMDVSATSTRMSKLTSDHKPLLAVDHLEASNLHNSVAKNREISIAIKEEEAEETRECDLVKKEEEIKKTKKDKGNEKEEEREAPALERDYTDSASQPEMDPASNSDKSGLLTTHL